MEQASDYAPVNLLLALATAALLVLAMPGYSISWLAPVALAPLLVATVREPRPGRRFLLGWAAGCIYWFAVCHWIQYVLLVHGGMGEVGSWGAFLLFCGAKAMHFGVFAWGAGLLMPRPWALPAVAALWVGIERTHGPLGFAWLALGNPGVDMGIPMRLAPWTGVYGLSFVFALMGGAVALVFLRRPRRQLAWLLGLLLLYLLPQMPEPGRGDREAVLVQPNVADEEHWPEEKTQALHRRLAYLSLERALVAGQPAPMMILWPEVPAPLYYDQDAAFRAQVSDLARLARTHLLFGTVSYTPGGAPLNSAQMLDPGGRPVDRYDKMYLVPFGEFIPPLFGFVNRITHEAGDFAPGNRLVVFPVGDARVGAFICYESAFPHLVRRFAAAGAQVFVNLTNDGYFGRTAARQQHLLLARMRAAENRRWLLRPTNDGITVVIDPAGRIRQELGPYREAALRARFTLQTGATPYSRSGDWFAWSALAASLLALLATQVPTFRRDRR